MNYQFIYKLLGKEYVPNDRLQRRKEVQFTQAVLVIAALAAVIFTLH